MFKFIVGIILILHGLVHLLYLGQSARLFNLQPGLLWPDGSWAFSKLLGEKHTRTIASALCLLAALGFVIAALGLFFGQPWWRSLAGSSAALSALLYLLLWNGRLQHLDSQGGIGLLIDLAIWIAVLLLRWPAIAI